MPACKYVCMYVWDFHLCVHVSNHAISMKPCAHADGRSGKRQKKLQALLDFQSGLPAHSQAALAAILEKCRTHGVPEASSSKMQRNARLHLLESSHGGGLGPIPAIVHSDHAGWKHQDHMVHIFAGPSMHTVPGVPILCMLPAAETSPKAIFHQHAMEFTTVHRRGRSWQCFGAS